MVTRVQLRREAIDLILDIPDSSLLLRRLAAGEVLEPQGKLHRLRLPLRAKLHGGRTWLSTSGEARRRIDPVLVSALRTARKISKTAKLIGSETREAVSPANAYERRVVLLAFLAPDLQQAILRGEQPPGVNLERLMEGSPPLAWADHDSWLAEI